MRPKSAISIKYNNNIVFYLKILFRKMIKTLDSNTYLFFNLFYNLTVLYIVQLSIYNIGF